MKKTIFVLVSVLTVGILSGCENSSDERCVYCGHSPSIAYKANEGHISYVCKNCSSECFFCGEKATVKFVNVTNEMTFMCKKCYESANGQ